MRLPSGRGTSGRILLDGRHDKFLVTILNSKWQKAFKYNSQEVMLEVQIWRSRWRRSCQSFPPGWDHRNHGSSQWKQLGNPYFQNCGKIDKRRRTYRGLQIGEKRTRKNATERKRKPVSRRELSVPSVQGKTIRT